MTEDTIIEGVIEREGGFTNHPADRGGPTKFGITAKTLGTWWELGRDATASEVESLTRAGAALIYRKRYIDDPGFTEDAIPFEPLRVQLIDFGVNSGPARAVRWLQRCMGPWMPVTGVLDTHTRQELKHLAALHTAYLRLLNDALVAARLYMVDSWTDSDASQKPFEEGVESRALRFFLAKPEKGS